MSSRGDQRGPERARNGMNSVELRGFVAREAELRLTPSGTPVAQFSLGYKYVYGGREKISYFDVVQFGPSAEDTHQQIRKGSEVEVYGRLEQDRWEDREGKARSKVQIIARAIEVVDRAASSVVSEFPEGDEEES